MIAYASRTGTKRNLAALRSAGWRLMVSARGVLRTEGFAYALDNGAWTAHTHAEPFDVPAFEKALDMLGDKADFVVLPDIVGGGQASLDLSLSWLDRVRGVASLALLPVQDGMRTHQIGPLIGPTLGVFVGGTTDWKLATMHEWCRLALSVDSWCHVARVNSARRIRLCQDYRATSFDGSSASRFCRDASGPQRGSAPAEPLVIP